MDESELFSYLKEKGIEVVTHKYISTGGQRSVYAFENEKGINFVVKVMHILTPGNRLMLSLTEEEENNFNAMIEDIAGRLKRELVANSRCIALPNIAYFNPFEICDLPNGKCFIIIENMIEGENFQEFWKKTTFDYKGVMNFLHQMIEIIKVLDIDKIVHRDISMNNIIYNYKNQKYKLIDAGLSKLVDDSVNYTVTGMRIGTPIFAPPECINIPHDMKWDFRTDLFSIGIISCVMLYPKLYDMICSGLRRDINFDKVRCITEYIRDNSDALNGAKFNKLMIGFLHPKFFLRYSSFEKIDEILNEMEGLI